MSRSSLPPQEMSVNTMYASAIAGGSGATVLDRVVATVLLIGSGNQHFTAG